MIKNSTEILLHSASLYLAQVYNVETSKALKYLKSIYTIFEGESFSSVKENILAQYIEALITSPHILSCQRKCSHCCKIPVNVFKEEWKILKTKPKTNTTLGECPFLLNDECSVYANRPLMCQLHNTIGPSSYCDSLKFPGKQIPKISSVQLVSRVIVAEILFENKKMGEWSGGLAKSKKA